MLEFSSAVLPALSPYPFLYYSHIINVTVAMLSSDGEQSWLHVPGPRSTIILGVAQLKEVD